MEYTVKKLGEIAGVSPRTLRYYDEIELLKPARVNSSGYRIYGQKEVDRLQQILFYKELGVGITSTTEKGVKGNIVDLVNHPLRIFNIGRLDKDSDGLILLTNDGDIVNEILRAENQHEKEYIVTVDRPIAEDFLKQMSEGVKILGTKTLPCKVEQISKYVFQITLTQGLNRQIRRMCEALGYEVYRLQRTRIMNIQLGNLPVGQWRDLSKKEKNRLFQDLDYEPKEW